MQFFLSTLPKVSPSEIVRSVKGRWQNLLRDQHPSAFRRNYRLDSVGAANSDVFDHYVAGQNEKHPMADPRVQERLVALQFHDPAIDLAAVQTGNYGQFVNGLQIVIETAGGWNEIHQEVLLATRDMIVRAASKKGVAAVADRVVEQSHSHPGGGWNDGVAREHRSFAAEQSGLGAGDEAGVSVQFLCGDVWEVRPGGDLAEVGVAESFAL